MSDELPQLIQDYLKLLESRDANQRKNAAILLGKSGNTNKEIIKALANIARSDPVDYVRATSALGNLGYIGNLDSIEEEISQTSPDTDEIKHLSAGDKLLYQIAEQQAQIINIMNDQSRYLSILTI